MKKRKLSGVERKIYQFCHPMTDYLVRGGVYDSIAIHSFPLDI